MPTRKATKATSKKPPPRKPGAKKALLETAKKAPSAKLPPPVGARPRKLAPSRRVAAAPAPAVTRTKTDFWQLLEDAWAEVAPELAEARAMPTEDNLEALNVGAEAMIVALEDRLDNLEAGALLAVDRTLERALYAIDREEIQQVTDGSDDGFLYARGFIVGMGKRFYDAVNEDPTRALVEAELADLCYLPWHLYAKKYGDPPASRISRESCSNADAW